MSEETGEQHYTLIEDLSAPEVWVDGFEGAFLGGDVVKINLFREFYSKADEKTYRQVFTRLTMRSTLMAELAVHFIEMAKRSGVQIDISRLTSSNESDDAQSNE